MNDHKRKDLDRARLLEAIRSGRARPLDRMGVPVQEGDRVVYSAMVDPVYMVEAVTPMLEPGVPAGYVRVTLSTSVDVPVAVGNPVQNLIVVAHAVPAPAGDMHSTTQGGPDVHTPAQLDTVQTDSTQGCTDVPEAARECTELSEGGPALGAADSGSSDSPDFSLPDSSAPDASARPSPLPFRGRVEPIEPLQ